MEGKREEIGLGKMKLPAVLNYIKKGGREGVKEKNESWSQFMTLIGAFI